MFFASSAHSAFPRIIFFKTTAVSAARIGIFNSACNFIGLLQETKEEWLNYKKGNVDISEAEIENKIELRNKARADKNYKEADNIRDYLLNKGVLIEDKDGKTIWKFK